MRKEHSSIKEVEAFLWNGKVQLAGKLIVTSDLLIFQLKGFCKSHLKWEVALQDLEELKIFLIYDISRNGLRIKSKHGQEDLFIIPDIETFIKVLKKQKLK